MGNFSIVTIVCGFIIIAIVWSFIETIFGTTDPAPWENHHYDIEK